MSFFHDRVGRLVRRFNMNRLLKNNAASFPCLWPVVGRGSYLLSQKSFDSGLWRIARTPAQFALEQGLLLDANGQPFSPNRACVTDSRIRNFPSGAMPVWTRQKRLRCCGRNSANRLRAILNLRHAVRLWPLPS